MPAPVLDADIASDGQDEEPARLSAFILAKVASRTAYSASSTAQYA